MRLCCILGLSLNWKQNSGVTLALADQIGVVSWNVNSLGKPKSQRTFINKIRGMKANVIFLLDTRLAKGDEEEFERMWGGVRYFITHCVATVEGWQCLLRIIPPYLTSVGRISYQGISPDLPLKPKGSWFLSSAFMHQTRTATQMILTTKAHDFMNEC